MRATVMLLFMSTVCFGGVYEDLVSISVRGTKIDRMPRTIDILTDTPGEGAEALVQHGGEINQGIPHSVLFHEVLYIFAQPSKWRLSDGKQLSDGDVIYAFFVRSMKEKNDFLKRYDLVSFGTMVERNGHAATRHAPTLYVASPHHYVFVMMPYSVFTCSMHPRIELEKAGKCPLCGMDLLETEIYR